MSRQYKNEKGFLIIEMNSDDARYIGFGFDEKGTCLCVGCNEVCNPEKLYYVAILNEIMCESCVKEFIRRQTRYDDDIPYEERNYNHYVNLLML